MKRNAANIFIAAIALLWAVQIGSKAIPASYWYEVGRVEVIEPTYEGDPIQLNVIREVKRTFDGEYSVQIVDKNANTIVCDGGSAIDYKPERNLPNPLTLDWWVGDPCDLPAGDYHMTTQWKIEWSPFELMDKLVEVDTFFSVLPSDGRLPEPDSQLGQQIQMLQQQVQELSQEVYK